MDNFSIFLMIVIAVLAFVLLRMFFLLRQYKRRQQTVESKKEISLERMQKECEQCEKESRVINKMKDAVSFPKLFFIIFLACALLCVVMYNVLPTVNFHFNTSIDKSIQIVKIQNEEDLVFFTLSNGQIWKLTLDNTTDALPSEDGSGVLILLHDKLDYYDGSPAESFEGSFSN